MPTTIEWTDETWNPVTGCTKVSQGCKHCYAERIFKRFNPGKNFTDVQCHPERLEIPLHWRKPRKIFVNSMSDLFHEDVPLAFIWDVWSIIQQAPQHTYQILTKRPERMFEALKTIDFIQPNVWIGVSVEDQATTDERIPWLLKTPAAVRFVSYEPALGPVHFSHTDSRLIGQNSHSSLWEQNTVNWLTGEAYILQAGSTDHFHGIGTKIDWIIAGGETGPGARPAHFDWFRSVRDQCVEAHVPFFFKQWGEWIPILEYETGIDPITFDDEAKIDNIVYKRVGRKRAGRLLDGREWNGYPKISATSPIN